MSVKSLLVWLALFWPALAPAQVPDTLFARCHGIFALCGLSDWETKEDIGPQVYERILEFSEGMAPARIDGRFGYIDPTGKAVITPAYDMAGPFRFGLAEVWLDGSVGIIDANGAMLVSPRFLRAVPVGPQVVAATAAEPSRNQTEPQNGLHLDLLFMDHRSVAGLYHVQNGWMTEQIYTFSAFDEAGGDLIWATAVNDRDGPWGLMRLDGSWQIEPIFTHVQTLNDGLALVSRPGPGTLPGRSGLLGAVDAAGNIAIEPRFYGMAYFANGYGLVSNADGDNGLLDKEGRLVTGRYYEDSAKPDQPGERPRVLDQGVWYEVQPDDSLTPYMPEPLGTPAKYVPDPRGMAEAPIGPLGCPAGARLFRDGESWGLLGPAGEVIIPAIYPVVDCFAQGVAWVPITTEKQWCPLGRDGQRRDRPLCKTYYNPFRISHHGPERLAEDPFDSSVLWMRAFLAMLEDPSLPAPRLIGDGVQGIGEIEVRGRGMLLK
jgi:WG containing repeat